MRILVIIAISGLLFFQPGCGWIKDLAKRATEPREAHASEMDCDYEGSHYDGNTTVHLSYCRLKNRDCYIGTTSSGQISLSCP